MSFDYSTLITNRARSDSDTLKTLLSKPMAEWTAEERTAFNTAVLKGSYDYTDLNRVGDCLEDLVARLGRVGCNVPGYERLKIERAVTPSSRLPEGYTEVQYIQSSGTQYIDSGVTGDSDTRVVLDFAFDAIGNGTVFAFGSQGTDSVRYTFALKSSGKFRSDYGTQMTTGPAAEIGIRYLIDKNKNVCKIGDTSVASSAQTFTGTTNIYLFARSYSSLSYSSGKMFFCKIFKGDTLLRSFVPCKDSAGAVGLYDLIGQKFYGNAGSGSFTAGPVVTWETDPEEPAETLDPYTWYESDVPVPSQMSRYRANVAAVRAALRMPEGTPETPETIRRLTTAEANGIEAILLALNFILNNIPTAVRHCGVTVCGSKGVRA